MIAWRIHKNVCVGGYLCAYLLQNKGEKQLAPGTTPLVAMALMEMAVSIV